MIKKGLRNFLIISTGVISFTYMMSSCKDKKHECKQGAEERKGADSLRVCNDKGKWGSFIYIGTKEPPIVEKKDTVIKFDILDGGLPPYSVLDSIAHLSHIADVYLKFAKENQSGPGVISFAILFDSLQAYSDRGIKIVGSKVYVNFNPEDYPKYNLVEKFAKLGITLEQDPAYKSISENNGTGTKGNPYRGKKDILNLAKGGKGKNPVGKNFTAYKTNQQNNNQIFYSKEFMFTA